MHDRKATKGMSTSMTINVLCMLGCLGHTAARLGDVLPEQVVQCGARQEVYHVDCHEDKQCV